MNIVVLDGYTLNPGDLSWDALASLGSLTVYDRTPPELLEERVGEADILFTNKTPLTAELLERHRTIRYIGVLATGYNVVDTAAAGRLGIPVCNVPTYGTGAVAQFVFALLLEICHHVGEHAISVRKGDWEACPDFCYWKSPLTELAGKSMGIMGFGKIGRAVAEIACAFGMKVLAYDRFAVKAPEDVRLCSFDEILRESDVLSLHCPLLPETQDMINRDSIAKMKDGAIFINTSRGPLVKEADLAEALTSGKIRAAGLDVLSQEPAAAGNPLLTAPNCFITPHIAWAPQESRARLMDIAVNNLKSFLQGETVNSVL